MALKSRLQLSGLVRLPPGTRSYGLWLNAISHLGFRVLCSLLFTSILQSWHGDRGRNVRSSHTWPRESKVPEL